MAGPLSFAQEEALRALMRGERFGIDARTERGLEYRGLVELRDVEATPASSFIIFPIGPNRARSSRPGSLPSRTWQPACVVCGTAFASSTGALLEQEARLVPS